MISATSVGIYLKNNNMKLEDLKQRIDSNLYNFNATEVLYWAWKAQENVILYGPGGYGKSDAAMLFAEWLKEQGEVKTDPYILAFGQGMTEERLLGGVDIKKFQDDGEIVFHLKHAFVSHEIVIFEELWDAFPAVLLILKDILQSKEVRMGNQRVPIKTKLVIAATNRSRDEVVEDQSTAALMERFVFEREVAWKTWEFNDYYNALCLHTNDNVLAEKVARIAARSSTGEHKISPRTAGKALKSAAINGVESLSGFYGFSLRNGETELDSLQGQYLKIKDQWKDCRSARQLFLLWDELKELGKRVNRTKVDDWAVELKDDLLQDIKDVSQTVLEKVYFHINKKMVPKGKTTWASKLLDGDHQSAIKLLKSKK